MVKPIDIYNGSVGLNTNIDPARLSQGGDKNPGMIELAVAVNVTIDDSGMVSLRRGDSLLLAGSFHSHYCAGYSCYVIEERTNDAALMQVVSLNPFTTVGIRSGLSKNRPMSFTPVGEDTLYSNGVQNGFIRNGVSGPWPIDVYQGPEDKRNFLPAPVGDLIAFRPGGHIYIAEGPILWINHMPFVFGLFNKRSGFVAFASDIQMICPVASGVFVSDAETIYFLRGTGPVDFVQTKVAGYPAHRGSRTHEPIELKTAISEQASGFGWVWSTPEGVCLGLDDGTMLNLTDEKIEYPEDVAMAACLITETHIINTTY